MIQVITTWVANALIGAWNACIRAVNAVLQWLADLVMGVLGWLLDTAADFPLWCLAFVPSVPQFPDMGPVPALIATANYFIPLDVVATCIGLIVTTYLAVYLYKLAKFARGGG